MQEYSLDTLRRHWVELSSAFAKEDADCGAVFEQLVRLASIVASAVTKRRELATNCAYLLLAESLNHAFATFVLIERGLLVDAALTSRNGVETLLLLELLAKQPELCEKWAAGDEFRPADVRRQLSQNPSTNVGDLVVNVSPDEYEYARFAYGWLSRITHANLESLNFATASTGDNAFVVHIGGAPSRKVLVTLATALGTTFSRALLTCCAAHAPSLLDSEQAEFKLLERRIGALSSRA